MCGGKRSKGLRSPPNSSLNYKDINAENPMKLDFQVLECVYVELGRDIVFESGAPIQIVSPFSR